MKKLIIFVFVLWSNYSYSQDNDSLSFLKMVDSILTENNLMNIEKAFSNKLIEEIKQNPEKFKRNNKFNLNNFYTYFSDYFVKEMHDAIKRIASMALSEEELLEFSKISFVTDPHKNTDFSVSAFEDKVIYENFSQLELFSHLNMNTKSLSLPEKIYFLTSLRIADIGSSTYFDQLLDFTSKKEFFGYAFNVSLVQYFIAMHEFYHIKYPFKEMEVVDKELKADSFALAKIIAIDQDTSIIPASDFIFIQNSFLPYLSDELKDSLLLGKMPLLNSNVRYYTLGLISTGATFFQFLLEKDLMTARIENSTLKISITRMLRFWNIIKEQCYCDVNNNNVLCKAIEDKINESFGFLIQLYTNETIKNKNLDKTTFETINPDDPAIISLQLGFYHWKLNDFEKAILYWDSANLYKSTSSRIICNLLLADFYLHNENNKNLIKMEKYALTAYELNSKVNIFNDEIFFKYAQTLKGK
jgi:hypothetical protein